jgi:hypothetical protein
LFPILARHQFDRWLEFFSAAALDVGFSGRPGASLSISSLDAERVAKGQVGEQSTSEGARGSIDKRAILFNSLIHPNHQQLGDLDHALLIGNRLLLIDSKRWRAADYSASQGNALRDGEPFDGGNISLGKWLSIMQQEVGPSVFVEGFVVLTGRGSRIRGAGELSKGVRLTTLQDFQEMTDALALENNSLPSAQVIQALTRLVSESGAGYGSGIMELSEIDELVFDRRPDKAD